MNEFNDFEYCESRKKSKNKSGGGYLAVGIIGAIIGSGLSLVVILNYGSYFNTSLIGAGNTAKTTIVNTTDSPVAAIAEKVGPSVVGIQVTYNVTTPSMFFGLTTQEVEGVGSGIIVRKDGYILTNYHVIENAYSKEQQKQIARIEVYLANNEEPIEAKIVGGDEQKDIAVIKIEKDNLTEVEFGNSDDLKVGELAVAIGNPLGLEFAGTVTQGVVSAVNRELTISENTTMNLIQTDAAINSGNSGGALVNSKGQVIGMNSVKVAGNGVEGIGFAIPINDIKTIMTNLIEGYTPVAGQPYIGIVGSNINDRMADKYNLEIGVYVSEVYKYSAAEQAGVKVGDVIVEFDGNKIETMEKLNEIKKSHKVGDSVAMVVMRQNERVDLTIILKEESY